MKKVIISLVLVLSMLLSFGLCTLSISATPIVNDLLLDEYGTLEHHAMNVHVQLGTYHNTFATTNEPFTSYYYALTTPNYYEQLLYNSRLKAASLYETYYYLNGTEMTITDDVYSEGNDGASAQVEGWDYDTAYLQLAQLGIENIYFRITNTVYSTATTEFYQTHTIDQNFYFDINGVMAN